MSILFISTILILEISKSSTLNTISGFTVVSTYCNISNNEWSNFSSINWSANNKSSYRDLYVFNAPPHHIVNIVFTQFDVGKHSDQSGCYESDHVRIYLHHDDLPDENTTYSGIVCGNQHDIPRNIYSSGPNLFLAVFTDDFNGFNSYFSFRGSYRFLNASFADRHNDSETGEACIFEYNPRQSNRVSGQFFSPRYPSNYRANMSCLYKFNSLEGDRVKIIFNEVNMGQGDESCLDRGDVIDVYEGSSLNSSAISRSICNEAISVEYVSKACCIVVHLKTASDWPPMSFSGTYFFITSSSAQARSQPYDIADHFIDSLIEPSDDVCDVKISSGEERSGNLTLPNHTPSICKYEFEARGSTRVKIKFLNTTDYSSGNQTLMDTCDGFQRVTALVWSEGVRKNIASFCNYLNAVNIMSNGPRLVLLLDSLNNSTLKPASDFLVQYSFIEDFGVTTGRKMSGYECAFLYTADDWPNGGYFNSPNYPGLYPRDTECHYFFHGLDWQRVNLTFHDVDIMGDPDGCDQTTMSDYLEFTNCGFSRGRKERRCGQTNFTSFSMYSERKYFRVTFKSNGRFEGTGFNASFRFFNNPAFLMTSINKSSVSFNMIWCMIRTVLKLIFLFFLLN